MEIGLQWGSKLKSCNHEFGLQTAIQEKTIKKCLFHSNYNPPKVTIVKHVLWTSLQAPPHKLDGPCPTSPHLLETRVPVPTPPPTLHSLTQHLNPCPQLLLLPDCNRLKTWEKNSDPKEPAIHPRTHYSLKMQAGSRCPRSVTVSQSRLPEAAAQIDPLA